jgi:hypothetical protein
MPRLIKRLRVGLTSSSLQNSHAKREWNPLDVAHRCFLPYNLLSSLKGKMTRYSTLWERRTVRRLLACAGCMLIFGAGFVPPASGQIELFGGYSYLRAHSNIVGRAANSNGWEASLSTKLIGPLGAEVDFRNHYGISPASFYTGMPPPFGSLGHPVVGSYVPQFTSLYGPRLTVRSLPRIEPFVHTLFGTVHGIGQETIPIAGIGAPCSAKLGCPVETINQTQTALAVAFGGGLNVKATHHVWIRLIQADYMRAQFSGSPQNALCISAGFVVRFGKW